jgi:hypothetical protein
MTRLLLLHVDGIVPGTAAEEAVLEFAREFAERCAVWRGEAGLLITWAPAPAEDGATLRRARSALAMRLADTAGQQHPGLEWDECTAHSGAGEPSPDRVPTLFMVTSSVSGDETEEFDAWYDTEHVPLLLRVPGWNTIRRYRVTASSRRTTHVALHYLDGPAVLDSQGRANAGRTEWTKKLATRPWFHHNVRSCYLAVDLAGRHGTPDDNGLRWSGQTARRHRPTETKPRVLPILGPS